MEYKGENKFRGVPRAPASGLESPLPAPLDSSSDIRAHPLVPFRPGWGYPPWPPAQGNLFRMRTPRPIASLLLVGFLPSLVTLSPPNRAHRAGLSWKLGPEDFASFSITRNELRRVPGPAGEFREKKVSSSPSLPSHGVFGWEVTERPRYFQTSVLKLLPFSVGTHLPGGEPSLGKRPLSYTYPWLGPYGRVVVQGVWETTSVDKDKGLVLQEGRFHLTQPRGKVAYLGVSLRWVPPARTLEGTILTLRRKVDTLKGRVLSIRTSLKGTTRPWGTPEGNQETPLDVEDRYVLERVFPHRYPEFEKDVREAIAGRPATLPVAQR